MHARGGVAVVEDRRFRDHRTPPGHPERPERLAAVAAEIAARAERLVALSPRPATDEEILRVHDRAHLEAVARAVDCAPQQLDPDTHVSAESLDVARLAAGGAIDLVRQVARGEVRSGMAAVRPPGHHAEADRAMGFCLFNNAAIAARAVQCDEGVERILLLDFDVHHGNGTQHVFASDPDILYFSTHQFPFYPGTGAFDEIGTGAGEGATVNVPLPAGCGDAEYTAVFRRILAPVALAQRPEMLIVSAGFDAHRDDPLGGMRLTGAGFRAMCDVVRSLADTLCGGRVALILEGGYAESGLREGSAAALEALLAPEAPALPPQPALVPGETSFSVLESVRRVHGHHFPAIGTE
jgi:acetoin utilization deacetylase AcuC-like enzyme